MLHMLIFVVGAAFSILHMLPFHVMIGDGASDGDVRALALLCIATIWAWSVPSTNILEGIYLAQAIFFLDGELIKQIHVT